MRRKAELLLGLLLLAGCADDPLPKPRGWFRIDLPEQTYAAWTDSAAIAMEVPTYVRVRQRKAEGEARWYDLRFPGQRATVHLTWSPVRGDLPQLIDDAHAFKGKHEMMAARIRSARVLRDSARVFGTYFEVEGDVASPMVFYLTDSTANFLYGSLYFDARPNADSLAPVTERIRQDMRHLMGTVRWMKP